MGIIVCNTCCEYGFGPKYDIEGAVHEVFADFGSSWEMLIVPSGPAVSVCAK